MRFGFRTIRRAIRAVVEAFIGVVGLIDHRLYMQLLLPHLRRLGVHIEGTPVYIGRAVRFDSTDYGLITVGDGAVISSNVLVLTHDFSIDRVLAADHVASPGLERTRVERKLIRPVKIGKRAFIGARSILMPGADIGEGAIIGAGSVVRGVVPAGTIAYGNPASVVSNVEAWAAKAVDRAVDNG